MSNTNPEHRAIKEILVVGHPRSGTGYMARLLQAYGLDVGHEQMGQHGISSWMFAADTELVPYTFDDSAPQDYGFRHVIHVVRDPVKVIASMAFTSLPDARTTNYMTRFITIHRHADVIEQAVQSFLGWNKLIISLAPDVRVKIEEADDAVPAFLRERGLLDDAASVDQAKLPPSNYNTRPHRDLTWQDIRDAVPPGLFAELIEFARLLGYRPDDTSQKPSPKEDQTQAVPPVLSEPQQSGALPGPAHATPALDPAPCIILVPALNTIEPACEGVLRELERRGYTVRRSFGMAAIDQARSRLATDALAEGFEELMWIDADMFFAPEAVDKLRTHQLPMVTAIAVKKGQRAVACEVLPGTKKFVLGEGGGLVEVRYAGTGFLLTRRQVYLDIQRKLKLPMCNKGRGLPLMPYFMPMIVPDGDGQWYLGEDYAFCERARRCGYSIHADTSIRTHHIGNYRYSWEDAGGDVKRYASYEYHLT